MHTKMKLRSKALVAGVAVAAGMAGFGITSAVANHDTNILHACAANRNGDLRLVADPAECDTRREAAVEWGAQGPQGVPGAPGTPATASISNIAGPIPDNLQSNGFSFAGPRARVTVTAGQTVVASVSGVIGSSGGASVVDFEPCYAVPGSPVGNEFSPNNYMTTDLEANQREVISSTLSVKPTAGTYDVGLCIRTGAVLDDNDWLNGTVTVFN